MTIGPDQKAPRREAAQAILQARLSGRMTTVMTNLHRAIDSYQNESSEQTRRMVRLTGVITWLTVVMIVAAVVQIWEARPKDEAPTVAPPTPWQNQPP